MTNITLSDIPAPELGHLYQVWLAKKARYAVATGDNDAATLYVSELRSVQARNAPSGEALREYRQAGRVGTLLYI